MASNLPPGVTESMLPGNRPEDRELEARAEAIGSRLDQLGMDPTDELIDKVIDLVIEFEEAAWTAGYNQAQDDIEQSDATRK